ncbi:MAG: flagellar basal body rod protein FlgB [Ignavibacterium sp.]
MADSTLKKLENLIDFTAQRQKVLNLNIANVNTENYKRKDVEFNQILSDNLNNQLKVTNPKHFPINLEAENNSTTITNDNSTEISSGINNVNIDEEMAEVAKNTILFKFASRKLNGYFKNIQEVIKGERS